ncbi:SWF/SNF helicase family protein [Microbacterium resistens]|uniref:hypothetical protein n=1 Tax=Microbacterium resistens TaxID=156977 RepID=UPI001C57038B|nr:hypothetical protein [Microbacterium resistens]MBW1639231.1 SWF/SNF helicase family protein [Microbacterium resistens]
MTWHTALLGGLAEYLAANGVGVYREDGVYADSERGIVLQTFPERPREIVALSLYLPGGQKLSPSATQELKQSRLQIRYRLGGHPFDAVEMFDLLHSLIDQRALDLGPIRVRGLYQSYSPMVETATGREYTTNWRFTGLAGI